MTTPRLKADEGMRIRMSGNSAVPMRVVEASCGLNAGHWFCAQHDEHFANNWQWWDHCETDLAEGATRFAVWVCNEHGPEVP